LQEFSLLTTENEIKKTRKFLRRRILSVTAKPLKLETFFAYYVSVDIDSFYVIDVLGSIGKSIDVSNTQTKVGI